MAESSFDIVCKVEPQELKNAIQIAMNEITNRFDFKGSVSNIELDKGGASLVITSDDEYKLDQVIDVFVNKLIKRKISKKALDLSGKRESASGNTVRLKVPVQSGLSQDQTKKITKLIKDSKLKVQAKIQGEQVRISGKSKDDLQAIMQKIRESNFDFETQFVNFR